MSGWDAYINILTGSSDCIKKCAIIGAADGSIWAKSEQFSAKPEELQTLATDFNCPEKMPQNGLVLDGVKFIIPWVNEDLVFGKKAKLGLFAGKSTQAIIIAIFEGESAESVIARENVEKLVGYLKQTGY